MEKKLSARRARMMIAVERSLRPAIDISVHADECKARCVRLSGSKKQECEDECDAWDVTALVAETLRRDLVLAFHDVIWGGGDIDPVPDFSVLERAVRERFSRA